MKRTDIIVNTAPDNAADQHREPVASTSLVSWVMLRVSDWEDHRQQHYDKKWDEYYRLWRGIWAKEDSSRTSERSRIITPALAQAIESGVAELEEATFGTGKWFDVDDDFEDEVSADIQMWRDQLQEDFEKEDVASAISEMYLNGALYGTGIAKIVLEERIDRKIVATTIGDTEVTRAGYSEEGTVRVGLVAVHPKEFVIDPTSRSVEEALGMAHITDVPKHNIEMKITDGTYREVQLGSYNETLVETDGYNDLTEGEDDKTMLVEYHGFVPLHLLESVEFEDSRGEDNGESYVSDDEEEMVEAIISIGNGNVLLRAVKNPYVMGDRCFLAYQHDTVPNRFWGRGIAEKGYNPQKALDAEARGRIDAMALSIHPMMAVDATRMHRGGDFKIEPGRTVFTNGNPDDILKPFTFGQVNPSTFSQSADLERQVQMGTGSMDSAVGSNGEARNATSGGMSMIMGGSIKRSKRTLANIERKFTVPFINKAAWRMMQFAPDRYPVQDMKFNVSSTLGIVARELEQQSLGNMMKTVPSESPAFWMLLKGIFEHSVTSNREEMLVIIDQMMKASVEKQAQPEQQDPLVALKQQEMQMDMQIEQAKMKLKGDADNKTFQLSVAKLEIEKQKLALDREEMMMDAQISLAGMEQDSLVTAAQMSVKHAEAGQKSAEKNEARTAAAPAAAPQVIQMETARAKSEGGKRVKVTRTATGLQGTVEDVGESQTIKVVRTADGLEGTIE